MYCRFWIVNQVNPALLGELLGGAGTGPASYLLGMQQKGDLSPEAFVASSANLQKLARQLSMFLLYCEHDKMAVNGLLFAQAFVESASLVSMAGAASASAANLTMTMHEL